MSRFSALSWLCFAVSLGSGVACARSVPSARADSRVAATKLEKQPPAPPNAGLSEPSPLLAPQDPPLGLASAVVDLRTVAGAQLVKAEWRYSDVRINEVGGRAPGADLKPSGAPLKTYDYSPKAGLAEFDDSTWARLDPTSLETRRGHGKLSFAWYRLALTVPERVGSFDPTGSTLAFEIVVDDYAEVWVDGKLSRRLGQSGGAVVAGFNAPNRVILSEAVRPGQRFQIAVFAMNGPISASPENFIWVKSATLDFHAAPSAGERALSFGGVERIDPGLDAVLPVDARIERLAGGFSFVEGPVWNDVERSLLFSDPNRNTIFRYEPTGALSVFRPKSGYSGADIAQYHQPGSNGLALDQDGRLTINEHGNRRVTRLEKNGALSVLAERFEGKRLNSPNDLVYKRDGSLYFTDPPFGLPKTFQDPQKELEFSGVFSWKAGTLRLVSRDLSGPNGLAFSPDEKYLYVDNWDEQKKVVMRYRVADDGSLSDGAVFFDVTHAPGAEALDGLKVDSLGNLFISGPGGVWIVAPSGKHLGTLHVSELPANFAWGDGDHRSLYMTARTGLYRVRLSVPGSSAFFR